MSTINREYLCVNQLREIEFQSVNYFSVDSLSQSSTEQKHVYYVRSRQFEVFGLCLSRIRVHKTPISSTYVDIKNNFGFHFCDMIYIERMQLFRFSSVKCLIEYLVHEQIFGEFTYKLFIYGNLLMIYSLLVYVIEIEIFDQGKLAKIM